MQHKHGLYVHDTELHPSQRPPAFRVLSQSMAGSLFLFQPSLQILEMLCRRNSKESSYVYVLHVKCKTRQGNNVKQCTHSIMPRHVDIYSTQVLYLQTLRDDPVFGGRCSPVSAHTRQCHGPHHSLPLAQTPVPPVIDGPPTHQVTA